MPVTDSGRYTARLSDGTADLRVALALRSICFRDGDTNDGDTFDPLCRHFLIEDKQSGRVICTFRFLLMESGRDLARSYAAQFYDLSPLRDCPWPMIELGRFCIHPETCDPDVLRIAWGSLGAFVEEAGVEMLFGCSSFQGTSARRYFDTFALLRDRHMMPSERRPRVKAPDVYRFSQSPRRKPDVRRALKAMPPLLRSYLALGGRVGDHAVVDRDLDTLHVFTALETSSIPKLRRDTLLGRADQRLIDSTRPSPVCASP